MTAVAHFDSGPDNHRISADMQATASARRSPVWRMEEGGETGHGGNGLAPVGTIAKLTVREHFNEPK